MDKTILVADDSKTMQRVFELTFRSTPFRVVPVGSGDEALAQVERERPDVVVLDATLSGTDGYALCQLLKESEATKDIPILLLWGAVPLDEAKASLANGAIKKPFETGALIDKIKTLTGLAVTASVEAPMSFAEALAAKRAQEAPSARPAASEPPLAPPSVPPVPSEPPRAVSEPPRVVSEPPRAVSEPPRPVSEPPRPAVAARAPAPVSEPPRPPASPFAAPRSEIPEPGQREEEPESVEAAAMQGPGLEPPAPPSAEDRAHAKGVDMWSLADPAEAEPVPREAPASVPPVEQVMRRAEERVVDFAQAATPGLPRDELLKIARQVIEEVAWEVVPDLAETIIREELRRLMQRV